MIEHYCALMEANDGYHASLKSTETETNYDVLVPYGVFAVHLALQLPGCASRRDDGRRPGNG